MLSDADFYEVAHCNCPCGEKFGDRKSLRNHIMERHELGNKFNCPKCNKEFISPKHLLSHLDTHRTAKDYSCKWPGCKRKSKSFDALCKHLKEEHSPKISLSRLPSRRTKPRLEEFPSLHNEAKIMDDGLFDDRNLFEGLQADQIDSLLSDIDFGDVSCSYDDLSGQEFDELLDFFEK